MSFKATPLEILAKWHRNGGGNAHMARSFSEAFPMTEAERVVQVMNGPPSAAERRHFSGVLDAYIDARKTYRLYSNATRPTGVLRTYDAARKDLHETLLTRDFFHFVKNGWG